MILLLLSFLLLMSVCSIVEISMWGLLLSASGLYVSPSISVLLWWLFATLLGQCGLWWFEDLLLGSADPCYEPSRGGPLEGLRPHPYRDATLT